MKKLSRRQWLYQIRKALRGRCGARSRCVTRSSPSRFRVVAPGIMNFDDNYEETAKFIDKIRRYTIKKRLHVFVDMFGVKEISPDAALVLAAELQRSMDLLPKCVNGRNPRRMKPFRILRGLRFHELLNFHPGVADGDCDDDLEYIHMESGFPGRTDFFPTVLKLVLGGRARTSSVRAKNRLTEGWHEALANATQHGYDNPSLLKYQASDKYRWWMAGYRDAKNKEAIFMVYDQGVTIPADLPRRWGEAVGELVTKAGGIVRLGKGTIDDQLLMSAMVVGRTRTDQRGRGWGFSNMHAVIDGNAVFDADASPGEVVHAPEQTGGSLRILSRRGRYLYHSGTGAKASVHSEPFWGTLIVWRLKGNDKIVWSDERENPTGC